MGETRCVKCNKLFDHDGVWFPAYCPECSALDATIKASPRVMNHDSALNDTVSSRDRPEPDRVTPITQYHVDQVIEMFERVVREYEQYSLMKGYIESRVASLRAKLDMIHNPQNLHLAHTVILEVVEWGFEELTDYIPMLEGSYWRSQEQEKEITRLKAEIERLQRMVWRPKGPIAVTLPEHTIQVRSQIQAVVLRLMAQEGLARSWRIQQRVMDTGLTQNENSVRNALHKLNGKGLVSNYHWNGHKVGWSPVPGGRRLLVTLTEKGQAWYRQAFGEDAVPSEIAPMAKKHNSVVHAVGILEARDHLRAQDYKVNDAPDPILAEEGQRWGHRAEPDLTVEMDGQTWPVEVQREVSPRHTAKKWAKALNLTGRLVLILFSEEKLNQQVEILGQAINDLPAGEIKLSSLEAMEGKPWDWTAIVSLGNR